MITGIPLPRAIILSAIGLVMLLGCQKEAEQAAITDPAEEAAAPPLDVPRNTWLTAETLLPLDAEGNVVRDVDRRPYSYALIGQEIPEFALQTPGGGSVAKEDLRGKWTVVDFWGVWCGDCRRDHPFVSDLAARLDADPALDFLAIHTPASRARAAESYGQYGSVEAFFAAEGGGFQTAVDPDAGIREAFQISWTPSYLLVGPDLKVVAFRTDLSTGGEASVDRAVEELQGLQARSR